MVSESSEKERQLRSGNQKETEHLIGLRERFFLGGRGGREKNAKQRENDSEDSRKQMKGEEEEAQEHADDEKRR